jgi:hypothetical protein
MIRTDDTFNNVEIKKEFNSVHNKLLENKVFLIFQTCLNFTLKWLAKIGVLMFVIAPMMLVAAMVVVPLYLFKFIFVNIRLYIKTKGKYPLFSDYDFSMDEDDENDESYAEITNPYLLKCIRYIDGHIDYEYVRFYCLFDAFESFCETINKHLGDGGRNT